MAIGQRPSMSFAIPNNMLTPSTKATNQGISPRTTTTVAQNKYENPKNGSFSMKHLEKCSYTIPKNPHKDKWGVMAKVWANKLLSKTKICSS